MKTQGRRRAILCSCGGQIELDGVQEALESREISCCRHAALCTEEGLQFLAGRVDGTHPESLLICACADEAKIRRWRRTAGTEDLPPGMIQVVGLRNRDSGSLVREVLVAAAYQKHATPVAVREAVPVPRDVLVFGSGAAGLRAAAELLDAGYPVTIADECEFAARVGDHPLAGEDRTVDAVRERVVRSEQSCVVAPARPVQIEGHPGDFRVTLADTDGDERQYRFGAVVLAPGCAPVENDEFLGAPLGGEILPVRRFDEGIAREEGLSAHEGGRPFQVVFVVPPEAGATEVPFMAAAAAARRAGDLLNADIYLLCNDAKVAAPGMEEVFRCLRDDGVTVIRYDEDTLRLEEAEVPRSYTDPRDMPPPLTLHFSGERLQEATGSDEWELPCDRLFVAEGLQLSRTGRRLAEILQLRRGDDGFLSDDNVYQLPVDTNRRGVFAVGSARRPATIGDGAVDAANAALAVDALLGGGIMTVDHATAVVQGEKCALCLTCVRSCPHVAISADEEEGAASVQREACRGCGICASECPADAIQLEGYSDASFAAAADVLRGVL